MSRFLEGAPKEEPMPETDTNKQREETMTGHKGNWRVPCSCMC
jgi:hypothetical protein